MLYSKDNKLIDDKLSNNRANGMMRLVTRNRRTVLFGALCLVTLLMVVFKFNEFRPMCLEPGSMVREEVRFIFN